MITPNTKNGTWKMTKCEGCRQTKLMSIYNKLGLCEQCEEIWTKADNVANSIAGIHADMAEYGVGIRR